MAISRKGIYIDDYLDYASTFPAELQRLLNTIRELDERSTSMINQTRQSTRDCLGLSTRGSKKVNRNSAYSCNYINTKEEDDATSEKMLEEIEANQDSALSFCTEKVWLVQQAYDLIDSHIKRLDEDLNNFSEDLKQEGKIPPDEPAILPSMPLVPKSEKWKSLYGTPLSRRLDCREDWDRESRRDFELMPPPGSYKEYAATTGVFWKYDRL